MTNLEVGYEVVCPDGLVRHDPLHRFDEAEATARRASAPEADPDGERQSLCPEPPDSGTGLRSCRGGRHTLRTITLSERQVA